MNANDFRNCKYVAVTPPGAILDNASATCAEIDTLGFRHARIAVLLGATDIAMATLKVQESDASGSGQADVTGLIYGTSAGIDGNTSAKPSATDDNKFFFFDIDLRARKRYLTLVATAGDGSAGTYLAAWAELYQGEALPSSAAGMGAANVLRV